MSSSQSPLSRVPAPRWLLLVALVVSASLHGGFAFLVDQVFSAPEIDIEFQLPIDVELGLTEELAMAPRPPAPPAPPPAPEPAPAPAVEPGEGPEKPEKPKKKPEPDAGAEKSEPHDAGPGLAQADAGTPETDAGTAFGDQSVGSRLPPGAQIALRVDMARIRASAIAEDMRAFVAVIPDWQALLEGSGISPVDQLDRLLIATPDLKREKVVLAGRFVGEQKIVEDAVEKMASARGKKAVWHPEGSVRVVPWFNADATPRVLALVGPQHFTISRIEDLPRVLSIAAARVEAERKADAGPVETETPADALLSMGEGEGLSLEVDGVEQFIKRAPRGVPQKLRIAALEVAGPAVDVNARLVFADGEKAADGLRFWEAVRKSYARNALMVLMGLAQPLQDASLELKEKEVAIHLRLSVEQTRLILGYVRELLTPPPPAPTLPSAAPAPAPALVPKTKPAK